MYILLSAVEEPFRIDLLIAGLIALAFGFLCLASNLTSRVLLNSDLLDVRDYGVRRVLNFSNISALYTIPSTFSTIIAFKSELAQNVIIHLGYWKDEAKLLRQVAQVATLHGIPCSPKAAMMLNVEPSSVPDDTRHNLEEGVLALVWILTSSVVPLLIGTFLA